MNHHDYNSFHNAWVNAHAMSVSNQIPADSVISSIFDLLSKYPLEIVIGAINIHSKQSRFAPTPADIFKIIDARVGNSHIGAEEAWSIALESMDEHVTVMMTKEIADARGIAWPIWIAGDEIGSRMAFRESYIRFIETAGPPVWFVSEGSDKSIKADAINRAVELGRITPEKAAKYLPAPMDGGVVGKLLAGKVVDETESGADEAEAEYRREVVRRMRGIINEKFNEAEEKENLKQQKKHLEAQKKREEFEQKRQQALEQIEELKSVLQPDQKRTQPPAECTQSYSEEA